MEFEIEFLISLRFGFSFRIIYMFSPSKKTFDENKLGPTKILVKNWGSKESEIRREKMSENIAKKFFV